MLPLSVPSEGTDEEPGDKSELPGSASEALQDPPPNRFKNMPS